MTAHASFALAVGACLAGWCACLMAARHAACYGFDMSTIKLAAAAGVGALLPFVPDLVKYLGLPDAASNALCAVVLAVAYKLVPREPAVK